MNDRRGRALFHVLASALALSALNAAKPIHIDDVVYQYYGHQAAARPLAPYDFVIPWNQLPGSAQDPIAPPVVPYWMAVAIRLFGERPPLWKLWFLPINLILTGSMYAIFRRFARGFEAPLTWSMALSPAILPSVNLMLDVPCLAFGLASLATFFRACDRRSMGLAALAGLACGLAMETKWTAFVTLALILACSILYARPRQGALAAAVAVLIFGSWEGYVAIQDGQSHFVHQLKINNPGDVKRQLTVPLVMVVGAVAPAVMLIGMTGLRASRRAIAIAGGLYVIGFGLLMSINPVLSALGPLRNPMTGGPLRNPATGEPWVPKVGSPFFLASGLAIWLTTGLVAWRLWGARVRRLMLRSRRDDLFLVTWLAAEVAGYFVFSPFPAVRRVIALAFVMTLLAGRLASRTCRAPRRAALIRYSAAFSAALGALYYTVDLREALAEKEVAGRAARWIGDHDPSAKAYFSGSGGFEYYAPRLGLEPMLPDHTHLKPGDWLVVRMDGPGHKLFYTLEEKDLRLETVIEAADPIPLTTMMFFYIGARPIEPLEGPRLKAFVYKVIADIRPTVLRRDGRLEDRVRVPMSPDRWADPPPSAKP